MGRTATGLIAIVILLAGCAKQAGLSEREIATQRLAEYLKTQGAPAHVLVISNPFSQQPNRPAQVYEFERAGIAGLKRGFGPGTELVVVFPEIKPEARENPGAVAVDPKSTTPLSYFISATAWDALIRAHPECKLVVSLIGLPADLERCEAWKKSGDPRFALLLPDCRMIGDLDAIQNSFTSGKIAAAVFRKPGAPADAAGGTDAFDSRFILANGANVRQLIASAPRLFIF